MKKKLLSVLLSSMLVFSYATVTSANKDINNVGVNIENENISPYLDNRDLNVTITKDKRSGSVTTKYEYIKIWFDNKGTGTATVHFQSTNGDTLKSFNVEAGSNNHIIYGGVAGGKYKYNVTTKGGATDASGDLKIRSATTESELE